MVTVVFFLSVGNLKAQAVEDDELFKPVEIKDGVTLSILDCVASAFKNSPKIRRQKYNLDIAKSNLGIAKSQYFPVINLNAGFYNENNSDNIYYNSHYRELPSVGVSINKLVWNFGKTTAYIKMEEFYKIGAEYEFMDSLCSTLFDVKAKYYALLKSQALLQVAKNNLEINEKYRGLGLSYQLLDYATKICGARNLAVKKDNTIAKHIYDKYGFHVTEEDDEYYYMSLDEGEYKRKGY